jgi:hypothetical protein
VSRSGFAAYLKRDDQAMDAEPMDLLSRVKAIHRDTSGCYGSRCLAKALQAEGFTVGRDRAGRWMKKAGVSVRRGPTRRPQTRDRAHRYRVAPHELARQFDVAAPHMAGVGEMIRYGAKKVGYLWRCSWMGRLVKWWAG